MTCTELAKRLEAHGLQETEASISSKLAGGTFAAMFLLATHAAPEMEGVGWKTFSLLPTTLLSEPPSMGAYH